MTTVALIEEFLKAYFVEHNPDKGIALVTPDVKCYGFADDKELSGAADLKQMSETAVHDKFMHASLAIEASDQVSADSAVLHYSLSLNAVCIHGRITGSSRQTPAGNRLYLMSNSMLNPLQTLHVYEDVAHLNRAELAKELLGEYVSGGMMGGYLEPGFPFYFINDYMLRYLGYAAESEFVESVGGLLANCIYAEDRDAASRAMREQLAACGKYEIDYRVLKKDGSFIWVHDVGKTIVAEDGRAAFFSACYDISSEKEHERFLEGLVSSLNGELALFAVDLQQKRTIPIYASPSMGRQKDITKENFLEQYCEDSMGSVYEGDRQRVWDAICASLQSESAPSISFRVTDLSGSIRWVNGSFAKHGEHNGLPVILVLFTAGTMQNDLQLHALSQNSTGIAVVDADTHEVYFVNDAMFRLLGSEPFDYTNKICPEILSSCGGCCENCGMHEIQEKETLDKTLAFKGTWLSLHAERRQWADKSVVSIYATDVTQQRVLEQQLEREDAQLQGILHNMDCGVCVLEYDRAGKGTLVYVSEVLLRMCETDKATLVAAFEKDPLHGVCPEDISLAQAALERTVAAGGSNAIAYRYETFGGRQIWVRAYFTVVKKPDGGCTLYFTYMDRTEEVRLKDQMKDLVENMPSGVCLYRWDGVTLKRLLVGQGFQDIFGHAAKDAVDSSQQMIYKIVHPDDVADLQSYLHTFLRETGDGTGAYSYRAWSEEKQAYCWVSSHAKKVKQSDGTYLLYVVYTNDTEQVELKNQLAATKTAVDAAVQYGHLGLWTYDLAADAVLQNISDASAYGYDRAAPFTPEMLIAKKAIHEEDAEAYRRFYRELRDGAPYSECEVRVLDKDKGYRWMHLYLVRQPEAKGKSPTAIGLSFDINREIESYHELARAQEQLTREKHVIDDLFENLPGGVVMYRWDGKTLRPLYVSKGFSELYGQDGAAMLMRGDGPNFEIVHPEDLPGLHAFIRDAMGKEGQLLIHRYRVWNKRKKEYIWIQLTGKVKHQPDGTVIAYSNYADVDAEVKAAREIRTEEELLETSCRMAHIWTFRYDVLEKRVYLSKFLQQTYGLPAVIDNYPEGLFAYPVILEEYRELYRQMVRKVDAGEDATTEMQTRMPDGTLRDVRFEWHITREKSGKALAVACFAMDISQEIAERKRIEKERQKLLGGDKKLTGYSITDLQTDIILEAKDFYLGSGVRVGDSCEEFLRKLEPFVLTEEDKQRMLEIHQPRYALCQYQKGITEWSADMRWVNANGHARWQRSVYSIIENSTTGALYLYCYLYDVMEEVLSQALFAGIQENLYLKTGIVSFSSGQLYDFEGGVAKRRLKVQDYALASEAYAAAQVLPEDAAMVREKLRLENVQKGLTRGKKDYSFIHRARKDSQLRHYQVRFVTIPEKTDICVCIVRDITELVEETEQKNEALQKALVAANAAAQAKAEFLSRMSHEIRTPMNAIMGMTAIAQDNKSDFLQVSDCLSKIDSSSRYLLTLINDILEMSRIESGKAKLSEERFDFAALMDGIRIVAEPLAKKSDIRLEIANQTKNGSYYGDHIRIQQVMINLLGNALKFTKKTGRVRFAVSAAQDTETETLFEFTVEDTGIGMSEAFMQKMFDAFSQEDSTNTSQYGGSGLGLAISKSLVEAMGGTITAESMVGIGTNFTVQIPLKKAKNELLQAKRTEGITEAETDALLKGKHVLMAEDHPMNIMVAKKLLERKGILVTVAENGEIAVDTFRHSAPDEYNAILMDIRMPVMDGLEATRQIRALDRPDAKTIPIIAMTANALEEDRKNSKAAGMNEHLAKPIEPKQMYQTLARQIARRTV